MKILADENVPYASILLLKDKGCDIVSVGFDNPSVSDIEVIEIANIDSRTIITLDRDFGKLIFERNLKVDGGIIYFRIKEFFPEEPGIILMDIMNSQKFIFQRRLTVIDRKKIRQRKY